MSGAYWARIAPADIEAAIGVPFASAEDTAWAQLACDGTNAYIASLQIAQVDGQGTPDRIRAGGTMLAVWFYKRRPMGTVEPGWEFTPTSDEVTAFYMLLGLGRHQSPVVA